MKLRNLFIVNTLVALVFAAGLLLAPKTMLTLFGLNIGSAVRTNATINLVTQLLGASLIVPGLLSWLAGSMQDPSARRAAAIPLLVFDLIGFGVSFFVGMLPKVMSSAGWAIVAIFLFFTLGFGYFLFMRPAEV